MRKKLNWIGFCLCIVYLTCALGCGSKPFHYHNDTETPEGPGLFSGDDGEFTVYKSKSDPEGANQGPATAPAAVVEEEETTASATAENRLSEAEQEFKDFQEWKKEKAEFEAFQEWKKSKEGAIEYQEFLEWKQWRDFTRWQEQQDK